MYAAFGGFLNTGHATASSRHSTPPNTQPAGCIKSSDELKSYQGMFRGAAEVSDFAMVTEYSVLTVNRKLATKA